MGKQDEITCAYLAQKSKIEKAQEENYRLEKLMQKTKEFLEEEQHRSKTWLEAFEKPAYQDRGAKAIFNDLWDNHIYAISENDKMIEQSFVDIRHERAELEREKESLDENYRKAIKEKDNNGVKR